MPSAEGLPEPPSATSWIEGNWFQIAAKLAASAWPLGGLALGLLLFALFRQPIGFLGAWVAGWVVVIGIWAALALDARNAAAPGWLASRSLYRWQVVDLTKLSDVRRRSNDSFRLRDAAGGRAVLALDQENAAEVLNTIRRDLAKARKGGVEFPKALSAAVDGRG